MITSRTHHVGWRHLKSYNINDTFLQFGDNANFGENTVLSQVSCITTIFIFNLSHKLLLLQTVFDMNSSTEYEFCDYLEIIIGYIDDGHRYVF